MKFLLEKCGRDGPRVQRTVESSRACAPPSAAPSDPIAAAAHDDGDGGGPASTESNIGHASISDGSLVALSSAAVLPLSDGQHAVDPDEGSVPMAAFEEGSRVCVNGLVAAAQHNGKAGTVLSALDLHTSRLHVLLDDGVSIKVRPSNLLAWSGVVLRPASLPPITVSSPAHDFPMLGLPPSFLRTFIEANGGEAAFHGLTTSHVKRQMIVPLTHATTLSLCEQMRQQNDCRVQTATWFVSHPWQIQFLDLVSALESLETLVSWNRLGQLFYNMRDCSRAQMLHEECLSRRKAALGTDHPHTVASLNNLAGVFLLKGEKRRALPLFEECLSTNRRVLGDDHPHTLSALSNVANALYGMGEYDRAAALHEDAVTRFKRILGGSHPSTLVSIASLQMTYQKKGDFRRALPLYEEYASKMQHAFGTKT